MDVWREYLFGRGYCFQYPILFEYVFRSTVTNDVCSVFAAGFLYCSERTAA